MADANDRTRQAASELYAQPVAYPLRTAEGDSGARRLPTDGAALSRMYLLPLLHTSNVGTMTSGQQTLSARQHRCLQSPWVRAGERRQRGDSLRSSTPPTRRSRARPNACVAPHSHQSMRPHLPPARTSVTTSATWPCAARKAALVWRQAPIPRLGEARNYGFPGHVGLRLTMQEDHHRRVNRPAVTHVKDQISASKLLHRAIIRQRWQPRVACRTRMRRRHAGRPS
jgi:hypothetical protein